MPAPDAKKIIFTVGIRPYKIEKVRINLMSPPPRLPGFMIDKADKREKRPKLPKIIQPRCCGSNNNRPEKLSKRNIFIIELGRV